MTLRQLPAWIALVLTFVLYAVLLNSVGPVILQAILTFGVPKTTAALLEASKDLSIAAASFFVASFLPLLGYRRGMALGLAVVAVVCFAVPVIGSFWGLVLQFIAVGVTFAVAKTSVYTILGLLTRDQKQHASATSLLEGCFMLGVLSSYWLFGAFINPQHPGDPVWLHVYWVLGVAAAAIAVLLTLVRFDERPAVVEDATLSDLALAVPRLLVLGFVLAFLACAFLDVLVEQSIGTWLPTFNREVLHLPAAVSIQLASFWAMALAVGRLGAGLVLRRVSWIWVLGTGIALAGVLLLVAIPLAQPVAGVTGLGGLPLSAFAIPVVGILLAPIYPVLCSTVLSALPSRQHAPMTGLILISSALGGTIGSFITGQVFSLFDGKTALLAVLPYLVLLLIAVLLFDRTLRKRAAEA